MSNKQSFKEWVEESKKQDEAFRIASISEKIKFIQKYPRGFAQSLEITTVDLLDNIDHYAKIIDERLKTQGYI